MPGPISDSYDPEWGTAEKSRLIIEAIGKIYKKVTKILKGAKPIYIFDLVMSTEGPEITATLTEKEWRLIRFCCERAKDSI